MSLDMIRISFLSAPHAEAWGFCFIVVCLFPKVLHLLHKQAIHESTRVRYDRLPCGHVQASLQASKRSQKKRCHFTRLSLFKYPVYIFILKNGVWTGRLIILIPQIIDFVKYLRKKQRILLLNTGLSQNICFKARVCGKIIK